MEIVCRYCQDCKRHNLKPPETLIQTAQQRKFCGNTSKQRGDPCG